MFPHPHEALPLPERPNLENFKKIAKGLLKSAKSGDARALTTLGDLATLSRAQFAIARRYGFESWPKFARHLESLARNSPVSRFEAAADAIVTGDIDRLRVLVREDPTLVERRSTRRHGATLLIYVAANGVEQYRQKTPRNIVEIADVLLQSGADVNAICALYDGACATLELAATSVHPREAGVQIELLQFLLDRGASLEKPTLLTACLGNGQPAAAEFLAARGARITLPAAGGLGHLDAVRELYESAPPDQQRDAFLYACAYGRNPVVEYLLAKGADLTAHRSDGQTALHWAVIGAQLDTVQLLLRHRPPLEQKNVYGGTAAGQAIWSAEHSRDPEPYRKILAVLVEAGARVDGE